MRIANIVDSTEAEGPGLRAALWVQGCTLNCPGCCNQEYLPADGGKQWTPRELAQYFAALDVEGITVLGGEPLQQVRELILFLQALRDSCDHSIMLFTGYRWESIREDKNYSTAVELCDLVIAGPFIHTLVPDPRRWIGSRNQTIHFVSERYAHLRDNWPAHRDEIEFHICDGEIIVHGTPIDWDILVAKPKKRNVFVQF